MADLKVALEDLAADSAAGLPAQTPAGASASTLALVVGVRRCRSPRRRLRRLAGVRHPRSSATPLRAVPLAVVCRA